MIDSSDDTTYHLTPKGRAALALLELVDMLSGTQRAARKRGHVELADLIAELIDGCYVDPRKETTR